MKLVILHKVQCEPRYSYSLIDDIGGSKFVKSSRYKIKNSVYNTISSLENDGLLKSTLKYKGGRQRKYYRLTRKGELALKEFNKLVKSMVSEIEEILGE